MALHLHKFVQGRNCVDSLTNSVLLRVTSLMKRGRLSQFGVLAGFLALLAMVSARFASALHTSFVASVASDVGAVEYVSTPVFHSAGLFSQLFVILSSALHDLEVHGNTSSKNWKITSYAPKEGSHWSEGVFDDVFIPTRMLADEDAPDTNYFTKVRTLAKDVLVLHREVKDAVNFYKRKLGVHSNGTICLHVRRGDKKEGIVQLTNPEILTAISLREVPFTSVYVLSDDEAFPPVLKGAFAGSAEVISFPERECQEKLNLTSIQCFVASVFITLEDSCKFFLGSSTSNLSRLIMLMGDMQFSDFDGILNHFSSVVRGQWYKLPDHCYVVDGILPSGEYCGYISYRCPSCRHNICSPILPCDMPP